MIQEKPSANLRDQTVTGVSWNIISQIVTQGFTFIVSIALARILGPKVYGLIGMITVFTGFAVLFGGLGLGAAIIQRRNLEERHLDTAFWINAVMGTGMTLVMVLLAPAVASFYHEPRLVPLTSVIAIKFCLDSLTIVQVALLTRAMRFRALAIVQIAGAVVSGLAGLGMALSGMGPWSLVTQTIVASMIQVLFSWKLANWRPTGSFELKACRELFGFSASVLAFDVVNYWARALDRLLIGRFIGAAALGLYSRAYSLMLLPLNQISTVVGSAMFPALSTIQDDKARVKRAYTKAIAIIGLITFPMMTGAFATSDHFILALLGSRWSEAVPLFRIFCWVGLLQSITTSVGWIYTSQGRTGLYFVIGAINSALCIIAFLIGIRWGTLGVVWSYLIFNLVIWYPTWTIPGRLIGLGFREMIRPLLPQFACALLMAGAVWGLGRLLPRGTSHWLCLVVQISSGAGLYFALVAGLRLDAWQEARLAAGEVIKTRLSLRKSMVLRFLFFNRSTLREEYIEGS